MCNLSSIGAVVLEGRILENVDRRRILETFVFYQLTHEPEGQLSYFLLLSSVLKNPLKYTQQKKVKEISENHAT